MTIVNQTIGSSGSNKSGVQISINLDGVLRGQGTPDELDAVAAAFEKSIHGKLDKLSSKIPEILLNRAETKRPAISLEARKHMLDFRQEIYQKWEDPIEKFRMLRSICFELGCDFARDLNKKPPKDKDSLREVLIVSQMRSCQIADEILYLIEGGFADGAMARSRSLHEISVISALVLRHGEEVARRYFLHKLVDLKKDVEQLQNVIQQSGGDGDGKIYRDVICREYEKVVEEFGKDFKNRYGMGR